MSYAIGVALVCMISPTGRFRGAAPKHASGDSVRRSETAGIYKAMFWVVSRWW